MKGFIECRRGADHVQSSLAMAQKIGRKCINQNDTAAAGVAGPFCFRTKSHNRSVDKDIVIERATMERDII